MLPKTRAVTAERVGSEEGDGRGPHGGALLEQYVRCGKPNCRCREGRLHGPYYYRFFRRGGRLRKRYVRGADAREQLRLEDEEYHAWLGRDDGHAPGLKEFLRDQEILWERQGLSAREKRSLRRALSGRCRRRAAR